MYENKKVHGMCLLVQFERSNYVSIKISVAVPVLTLLNLIAVDSTETKLNNVSTCVLHLQADIAARITEKDRFSLLLERGSPNFFAKGLHRGPVATSRP